MKLVILARITVLVIVLLIATVPGFVYASSGDETTPGTLSLVPTIECIGAVVSYTNDNNENCNVVLEYRAPGGTWQTAPQMYDDRENREFRGSIFWLYAGTLYEVRVTFYDIDGVSGTDSLLGSVATRNDNPPSNGRTLYVATTGDDSNVGTDPYHPFKTIQKAADEVIAGDTVLVRAGTYSESVNISCSGTADNFITFRPYGSELVTLDGNNNLLTLFTVQNAGYVRIKGFRLVNTATDETYGGTLRLVGAHDCILEDNVLLNPGGIGAIMVRNNSAKNLIQRNTITLTQQTNIGISGIYWWKAGEANVFRHNNIIGETWGLWDGMGGGPENELTYLYNTDIYDNTIIFPPDKNPNPPDPGNPWWDRDDGIQPEGGNINVRIWGNWIENALVGIASAPTILGPTYIFRNVIVDSFEGEFKLGDKSYGRIYIYHNTCYTSREADGFKQTDYGVGNIVARNNIVHVGRKVIEANTVIPDIDAFDFDYDNLYTDFEPFAEYYAPNTDRGASTLEHFQANGIEEHGFSSADDKFVNVSGCDFHLQPDSPDVDKGVPLQGFNDSGSPWPYSGLAPDLGAYEMGASSSTNTGDPGQDTGGTGSQGAVGGGGGGGTAGVTSLDNLMTPDGKLVVDVNVACVGTDAYLNIPAGTVCKGINNTSLYWVSITALTDSEIQPYSAGGEIIGSRLFKMDPEGATFDPPILLTVKYDRSLLPSNISEDKLTVATWDVHEGEWIALESSVDIERGTISAYISHFSMFTVIADTSPAMFELSTLTVAPDIVSPDEKTHISVSVKNNGNLSGDYTVVLKIDGTPVQSKEVTLPGGSGTKVDFDFSSANSGTYSVEIGNLSRNLTVAVPETQTTPEQEPEVIPAQPNFSISALTIMPEEAVPGESVIVVAVITNDSNYAGTYNVALKLNGYEESNKDVTLDAGESETIYFSFNKQEEGAYIVSVGYKTTSLVVKKPALSQTAIETMPQNTSIENAAPVVKPSNVTWWLPGTVIVAVIIVGALVLLVVRQRFNEQ